MEPPAFPQDLELMDEWEYLDSDFLHQRDLVSAAVPLKLQVELDLHRDRSFLSDLLKQSLFRRGRERFQMAARGLHIFLLALEEIMAQAEDAIRGFMNTALPSFLSSNADRTRKHRILGPYAERFEALNDSFLRPMGFCLFVSTIYEPYLDREPGLLRYIASTKAFALVCMGIGDDIRTVGQALRGAAAAQSHEDPQSSLPHVTTGIRVLTDSIRQVRCSFTTADLLLLLGPLEMDSTETCNVQTRQFSYRVCSYSPVRTALMQLTAIAKSDMTALLSWNAVREMILQALQDAIDDHRRNFNGNRRAYGSMLRALLRGASQLESLPSSYYVTGVERYPEALLPHAGGFGDVFQGQYQGVAVALKVLRVFDASSREITELPAPLLREIVLWRQLEHPNIQPFIGVTRTTFAPRLALVSPWQSHGSIRSVIKMLTSMELVQLRPLWLTEIAGGLAYLHDRDVVHGDLRGDNVLIDNDWHARLTDFGLTTLENASSITNGSLGGTTPFGWIAPELLEDNQRPNFACDVFSFGRTCVEIYSGQKPFGKLVTDLQVCRKLLRGEDPPRPTGGHDRTAGSALDGGSKSEAMPDALWDLVLQCWEKDPEARPGMEAIAKDVKMLFSSQQITIP